MNNKIKTALLTLVVMLVAVIPSKSQDTKANLITSINSNFPDNTVGAITPAKLRTVTLDIVNSYQQYTSVNAQTGTTYTVLTTDYGKLVTFNNAAPVAVTLPAASGSFAIFNVYMSNLGAGPVTITPTSGTINGAASASLVTSQSFWLISDGTNWQLFRGFGSGVVNSGTAGRLAYYPSTGAAVSDIGANGSANQILQSTGGSTAPAWSTATYPGTATGTGTILRADGTNWAATTATFPNTAAQGDLFYASAANVWASLAKDTNATRYLSNTGTSNAPAWAQISLTNGVTGALPILNGGTGQTTATAAFDALSPNTTRGDITVRGASNNVRLPIGAANTILKSDGTDPSWATVTAMWDTLSGCTTQGAVAYRNASAWVCLAPGTSGQVLQSGGAGANLSWLTVTGTGTVTSVSITAGTGITQSGSPVTTSGAITVNADIATAGNFQAGTSNKVLDASVIYSSETTTAYGTTTTFDANTFINTKVTLTGNITTMTCSNFKAGQAGMITFIQDGTGSRTTVWCSTFKFAGGSAPTLTTTASATDTLVFNCRTSTFCVASLIKAPS